MWNPNFSNQNLFPLELISVDATFNFWNSQFIKPISISLGGLKNRDYAVCIKDVFGDSRYKLVVYSNDAKTYP